MRRARLTSLLPLVLPVAGSLASSAAWLVLVVVSALGWYVTGRGLAFRLGIPDFASGAGLACAVIVVATLITWARGDAEARALASLRCPACRGRLATRHEHAVASMPGRQLWSCAACGFGKIVPLTCDACAA
ncbi:MAG: hypothetical protein IT299_12530 [Dehalococcoidia bacterium]|nr:hypothetical protein [Dehalococcoidia bacterium]